jgi:hypothetical protein
MRFRSHSKDRAQVFAVAGVDTQPHGEGCTGAGPHPAPVQLRKPRDQRVAVFPGLGV